MTPPSSSMLLRKLLHYINNRLDVSIQVVLSLSKATRLPLSPGRAPTWIWAKCSRRLHTTTDPRALFQMKPYSKSHDANEIICKNDGDMFVLSLTSKWIHILVYSHENIYDFLAHLYQFKLWLYFSLKYIFCWLFSTQEWSKTVIQHPEFPQMLNMLSSSIKFLEQLCWHL